MKTSSASISSWTRDPNPEYVPAVWRRGVWSFQLHPVSVLFAGCNWVLATAFAFGLPATALSDSLWWGTTGVMGLVFGTILTFAEGISWVSLLASKVTRSPPKARLGVVTTLGAIGYIAVLAQVAPHH